MANIQNQQMRLNISSENLQQYAQQSRILKEIERNKKQKKTTLCIRYSEAVSQLKYEQCDI